MLVLSVVKAEAAVAAADKQQWTPRRLAAHKDTTVDNNVKVYAKKYTYRAHRHTHIQRDTPTQTQTYRQAHRHTEILRDTQRHTETHRDTHHWRHS